MGEVAKKTLITGSGRCGTLSMSIFLNGTKSTSTNKKIKAGHETKRRELLLLMRKGDWKNAEKLLSEIKNDVEVSPYISLFPENPNREGVTITLIRDGRETIRSGMNSGWFLTQSQKTSWEELSPKFKGDRFEKCCQFWVWVYEKLQKWDTPFIRLEDIINQRSDAQSEFLKKLELTPKTNLFPRSNLATQRKKRVQGLGYPELNDWNNWSIEQKRYFREKCGNLMKKYYPEVDLD